MPNYNYSKNYAGGGKKNRASGSGKGPRTRTSRAPWYRQKGNLIAIAIVVALAGLLIISSLVGI